MLAVGIGTDGCHRMPWAGSMKQMWVGRDCKQMGSAAFMCGGATVSGRTLRTGPKSQSERS